MVNLGGKIKTLRLEKNLTQKQLSIQLGVTISAISAYESEARRPSYDVLIGIAAVFHVSTDYLLGREKLHCLDVTGLSDADIEVVNQVIEALRRKNERHF